MQFRLFQRVEIEEVYQPPHFRYEEGSYFNRRNVHQPVLQYLDEATQKWVDVPTVQEISYIPHGKNTPLAIAVKEGKNVIA